MGFNYVTFNALEATALIAYSSLSTFYMEIVCVVTQRSILGPLFFLIYINNLHKASKSKNQLYSLVIRTCVHYNINILLSTVNLEVKSEYWFKVKN